MQICVVSIREYSRLNSKRGRTSDGWFYGDQTIYKSEVYIEQGNLSIQELDIISRFISKQFQKEHDTRTDGPEEPLIDKKYNESETLELIRLLDDNKFEASSAYKEMVLVKL